MPFARISIFKCLLGRYWESGFREGLSGETVTSPKEVPGRSFPIPPRRPGGRMWPPSFRLAPPAGDTITYVNTRVVHGAGLPPTAPRSTRFRFLPLRLSVQRRFRSLRGFGCCAPSFSSSDSIPEPNRPSNKILTSIAKTCRPLI